MSTHDPKSISGRLAGLSVSAKIGLGFAIVLVLHLSVVALGHYGVRKAERDRHTQSALLNQVEAFYQIDRLVGELQRNVLLFASTGNDGPGERVARLQRQLRYRLDEAAASQDEGVDISQIDAMRKSLTAQQIIFKSVVADRAKRRKLVDEEFVRCEERFDAAINAMPMAEGVYAARAAFQASQLNALRFVNNPDSELVRTVKRRLVETRDHLAAMASPSDPGAAALEATVRFEAAFIQMVQATRGYLHLVNVVLAGESVEFLHLAEAVRNRCSLRASRLTSEMQRDSQRFELVNNVFSALTIVLGVLAAWLIGRAVAPPLNAITKTIDGLARGESCESIPGVGRRDELGQLAHAAEVFRTKAAETERLLTEVTRMKDMERQLAHAQKLESMGQLAAGIAHEINTPMQVVASNVDFLADAIDNVLAVLESIRSQLRLDSGDPDKLRHGIGKAINDRAFSHAVGNISPAISDTAAAAKRVVEIVRAMKTMSHPGQAELAETDVNQLATDAATLSCNRWKYVAALDFELDEDLPQPQAIASTLSQVLLNLLVNAADAVAEKNGEGGPLGSIVVRTYADADSVFIEVEDSGVGVPEDRRERVFEPFYTTKEVGKGTGQGLAFCYDVVARQHQGEISVQAASPGGARFVVRLPIAPPEAPSAESDAPAAATPSQDLPSSPLPC